MQFSHQYLIFVLLIAYSLTINAMEPEGTPDESGLTAINVLPEQIKLHWIKALIPLIKKQYISDSEKGTIYGLQKHFLFKDTLLILFPSY